MKLRYLSLCLLTAYLNAFSMNQFMQFLGYKKDHYTIYDYEDFLASSPSYYLWKTFPKKMIEVNTALIPLQKDFKYAYFPNADLNRKDLRGKDFQGANLLLASAYFSDAEGANFSRANLDSCNFGRANLKSAKLKDARLSRVRLFESNLQNVDLRGSEMTQACITQADLTNADLRNTDLTRAVLTNTNLTGAKINKNTNFANVTRYDNPEQNRDWLTVMSLFAKISQN